MDVEIIKNFMVDAQKKEQQQIVNNIVDMQIKILAAIYDKATTYTQLIIIVGYASFFGIWSFVKGYISEKCVLWSAIFMSVSVTIFVLFEVCKMIYTSWFLLKRDSTLKNIQNMDDPQKILDALRRHDKQVQRTTVRWGKFWCWIIVPTVLFAVIAIAMSLIGFIAGLLPTDQVEISAF
ncbi:MAG: hypothetical protein GWP14_09460 [Actinobacteria bacterium]|nr:hypothetical protein [Actinomycetota bacterium]